MNAYRIGVTPQPLWYNTMELWGGSSLSYASSWELVGAKPSQQGRALISYLLGTSSCMTWKDGCVGQPLSGRWFAYFHKVAFSCPWNDMSQRTTYQFGSCTYA